MARIIETLEGVQLSKVDMEEFTPLNCYAYFLSDREVALLVSVLRYAEWVSRWENRDADLDLVYTLEHKLMSVCNIELQLNRIANALYAEPDAGQVQKLADAGISDKLETSVAAMMAATQSEDYTEVIENIGTVLGFAAAAA